MGETSSCNEVLQTSKHESEAFEIQSLRSSFAFRTLFVVLQLEPSPAKYGVNDGGEDDKTEDI